MSLVNDMLRDLNKRTPVSNKAARVHGTIHSSIESKRPQIKRGLILAGGLLGGLAVGYFYFNTMGVQVVEVPLAVVPGQSAPATQAPAGQPVPVTAEAVAATNAPAPVAPAPVASEIVAEILEQSIQPNGFTLRIKASEQVTFNVTDRSASGLTLHLDGIDDFSRENTTIPGMSVLLVSDGLDIGIELNDPADFLVHEDTATGEFDILLTASFRPGTLAAADTPAAEQLINADAAAPPPLAPGEQGSPLDVVTEFFASAEEELASLVPEQVQPESTPLPQPDTAVSPTERSSPVRVNREMSLEDRDRNNSQEAVMLVQGGRINEAYQQLGKFLDENPAGHQSRETLATLQFAQQRYPEANATVDAGLQLAPNYGSFKKIKARLLMQENNPAGALSLLRNVPPAVATDTEYHELLASLYQQGSLHELAVSTYQDLLRIDRQQGRWWTGLAISLEAQDKDSDALASYRAALQTTTLDPGLRQYIQNRIVNLGTQQ